MNHFSKTKKTIASDVDNTLCESRQAMSADTAGEIYRLLRQKNVAIITGGSFEHIREQIIKPLETVARGKGDPNWSSLILLPTNGGGLWIFDRAWREIYSQKFRIDEKDRIINTLAEMDRLDPVLSQNTPFGEEIQDRGSEITYSALGNKAPLELKKNWDPDFSKRLKIQEYLRERLPEFEIKIGGTTSIDITPKGMDKAYGIKQLLSYLKQDKSNVLFFGDAVYVGGNDYPVKLFGVETIKVSGPDETLKYLRTI